MKRVFFLTLFMMAAFTSVFFAEAKGALRIVSHLPSLTEIVYALGLGDNLVGVCNFAYYPPQVSEKTRVGGLTNTNFETVLALKPTLVLVDDSMGRHLEKYGALGINTLSVKTMTVADVLESIIVIGKATGKEDAAQNLVKGITDKFNAIREKSSSRPKLSALLVIGHDPGELRSIFVASKSTFHDEILTIAGGNNSFGKTLALYPEASKESIVKIDPQCIIIMGARGFKSSENIDAEKALWGALPSLGAVKSGSIFIINEDVIMQPGPRMAKAAALMSDALDKCAKNYK